MDRPGRQTCARCSASSSQRGSASHCVCDSPAEVWTARPGASVYRIPEGRPYTALPPGWRVGTSSSRSFITDLAGRETPGRACPHLCPHAAFAFELGEVKEKRSRKDRVAARCRDLNGEGELALGRPGEHSRERPAQRLRGRRKRGQLAGWRQGRRGWRSGRRAVSSRRNEWPGEGDGIVFQVQLCIEPCHSH